MCQQLKPDNNFDSFIVSHVFRTLNKDHYWSGPITFPVGWLKISCKLLRSGDFWKGKDPLIFLSCQQAQGTSSSNIATTGIIALPEYKVIAQQAHRQTGGQSDPLFCWQHKNYKFKKNFIYRKHWSRRQEALKQASRCMIFTTKQTETPG